MDLIYHHPDPSEGDFRRPFNLERVVHHLLQALEGDLYQLGFQLVRVVIQDHYHPSPSEGCLDQLYQLRVERMGIQDHYHPSPSEGCHDQHRQLRVERMDNRDQQAR
jgi:hypothetical protein